MPAETASLPLPLFATIPLWPLVGAVLVGVMLALKAARQHAHWPVILGVGVSAIISIQLFVSTMPGEHASAASGASTPKPAGLSAPDSAQPRTAHEAAPGSSPSTSAGGAHPAPPPPPPESKSPDEKQPHATPGAGHGAEAEHEVDRKALVAAHQPHARHWNYVVYHWISLGAPAAAAGHWIDVNFYFDTLAGIMLVTVCVVALMVVIYSVGYMRDHHGHREPGYERFFAFLGLFVYSMCMLVAAGNFVLLYLGWELVGLCSYLLIGFYYQKPEAAAAAKKAFLVNRIGDFGFALGIFALYMYMRPLAQPGENPLDYVTVFKYATQLTTEQSAIVSLLLFCGAMGKSAQFPLYTWLPDAMEGPSPVSALIHAATMVTAGVYLVARCSPLFVASETALFVVMVVGLIGALLAATMAMAQYDMKRILAYSTMSQLAYMFVGLGVGVPASAIFHLFTHAFFKALLFLCAGSVMHAMGGVIDLRRFSGLRGVLPRTYQLMAVGCLALAGFPLLSGFWSKDEIVHAAWDYHPFVGLLLLLCAFMTAYYTFRMFFLCFHGPQRLPEEAGHHPHESPPVMLGPLYPLALGAIAAGALFGATWAPGSASAFLGVLKPHGFFHHYVENSSMIESAAHGTGGVWLMYVSALVAIGGIWLAHLRYGQAPAADPDAADLGVVWRVWNARYWVDEIYDRVFVRPLRRLGTICFGTDSTLVDGIVWTMSALPRGVGAALRGLQQGALQGYALTMVAGLAVLVLLWGWAQSSG